MDQDAFRTTYREINQRYCAYEKAILTNNCACHLSHKFCIAEREGVQCASDEAQSICVRLLELLRTHARFAIRTTSDRGALPHAKAMRIQVGGLRGIEAALNPDQTVPVQIADIRHTVEAAIARFGSLEGLPFSEIVKQITAYQGRQRRKKAK